MLPDKAKQQIEFHVAGILQALGYDTANEHFIATPKRIAKMMSEVLDGNFRDPVEFRKRMTVFEERSYNGPVMECGVPFYSFCAHHGALFHGRFSLGYYTQGTKVLGLSKLVRIFREGCHHLTTQEAITQRAVDLLVSIVETPDVMCHVVAEHTCMSCRSVQTHGAMTSTYAYGKGGIFERDVAVREQFLAESRSLGVRKGGIQ